MQLTKRFFAMNALAVFVSIGLTAIAVMIFIASYTKVFGQEAYANEWKRFFEVKAGFSEMKREALTLEFDQLLNQDYQQELFDRVTAVGGSAVLLRNREVLYSTRPFNEMDIEKSLMLSAGTTNGDTLELGGKTFLFARASYQLNTEDMGVLLLLAPIRLNTSFYSVLGIFTAVFFLLVFLVMNLWVSYRFSRGIIIPVSRLRDSAVKISEGDLNDGIAEEGEGEVRELSRTLELMRIKLKESIYFQQKYDENRKFLVSSISHDLKTPVTSIKGYIEGIMDGVATTPEKMEAYLETARSKAILVNTMIDDLLLYSKLDLNQLPYHFEKCHLADYMEDCIEDNKYEFEKRNIRLELVNQLNGAVYVLMDRERLMRVIQNIMDNSAKYLDKDNGTIVMMLRETRTSAIIEIRDNGKGIPEQQLPHIFDRFFRVDSSRGTTDGSGLGLAIAKQIVEGHEGKLWATSTAGEGTSMLISLKKL